MSNNLIKRDNLSDPHNWISEAGSDYVFWDPVRGEQDDSASVPYWLEQEPTLKTGIDYLRDNSPEILIAFGQHAAAEDLGPIENGNGWFERQVYEATHYGYENFGYTDARGQDEKLFASKALMMARQETGSNEPDYSAYLRAATSLNRTLENNTYHVRFLRMIALARNSFSYDIRADRTTTEQGILLAFINTVFAEPTARNAAEYLATVNAREWCMVANTGRYLCENHSDEPTKTFITQGALHGDVVRKFQTVNTNVDAVVVEGERDLTHAIPLYNMITATFAAHRITVEEAAQIVDLPSRAQQTLRDTYL